MDDTKGLGYLVELAKRRNIVEDFLREEIEAEKLEIKGDLQDILTEFFGMDLKAAEGYRHL